MTFKQLRRKSVLTNLKWCDVNDKEYWVTIIYININDNMMQIFIFACFVL